ncbi:hypothetical protein D9M71_822380 [compost metagenome]
MHQLDALGAAGGLFGEGLQVGARSLAGEQDHAVVAGHHDVRSGVVEVGVAGADLAGDPAGDELVIDLVADAARTAAGQQHAQGQGGEKQGGSFHSSLPNS